jgi:hypothetical protein
VRSGRKVVEPGAAWLGGLFVPYQPWRFAGVRSPTDVAAGLNALRTVRSVSLVLPAELYE